MSDRILYRVGPRGPAGRGIIIGEGLPPTDQDVLREFIVGSAWFDSDTGRLYGPLVKPDPASNDVTFGSTVIYDFTSGGGGSGTPISVQDTPPDNPSEGALWVDTSEDPQPGAVAASAVTAAVIDRTHLFGGNVQAQIDATDAFFTELCGGGSAIKGDHVSVNQIDMGYMTLTSGVLDGVVNQADTKFTELDEAIDALGGVSSSTTEVTISTTVARDGGFHFLSLSGGSVGQDTGTITIDGSGHLLLPAGIYAVSLVVSYAATMPAAPHSTPAFFVSPSQPPQFNQSLVGHAAVSGAGVSFITASGTQFVVSHGNNTVSIGCVSDDVGTADVAVDLTVSVIKIADAA